MEQLLQQICAPTKPSQNYHTLQDPIVHTHLLQASKAKKLLDWFNTPLYKTYIEGVPELEAICQCVPEDHITDLCHMARDLQDPF